MPSGPRRRDPMAWWSARSSAGCCRSTACGSCPVAAHGRRGASRSGWTPPSTDVVAACADPRATGRLDRRGDPGGVHPAARLGWAHSVEAWRDGELVGGLYGVAIGGLFAGESMFHRERDASKVALVGLVDLLARRARGRAAARRPVADPAPGHRSGRWRCAAPTTSPGCRTRSRCRCLPASAVEPVSLLEQPAHPPVGQGLAAGLAGRAVLQARVGERLTSRTVSPQTGHFSPVRPCTARLDFFSPLSSLAARPRERVDRVAEDVADGVVQRLQLGVARGCWRA